MENSGLDVGELTFRLTEAVPELPASDVKSPEVMVKIPDDAAVNTSETSHEAPGAMAASANVRVEPPEGALTVAPEQDDDTVGDPRKVSPAGSVVEKALFETGTP
ncbi:hypothetical protein, partial [uncultured Mameliella sp.]|uniref:hypothetical protein n=1 Tax=uncultured Mameliella sp. TaxID=1447087 RepID=UPI002633270A